MTQGVEMLPVEQSDRDAVQAFHRLRLNRLMEAITDEKLGARLGEDEGDAGDLVQAFARHRLSHTHPAATGSVRVVPVEPTQAMREAGEIASRDDANHMPAINLVRSVWSAMIAAAPTPDAAAIRPDSWTATPEDVREQVLLLAEVELHLQSCRVFLTTREKMHPCGVDLHDELLAKVTSAIETIGREKANG